MIRTRDAFLGIVFLSIITNITCNLLKNADFENTTYSDWFCSGGCTLTSSQDAYRGQYSALVSNRNQKWESPTQSVNVQGDSRYRMTAQVKLVSTGNGQSSQSFALMLTCKNAEGSQKFYEIGSTQAALLSQWTRVDGIANVPIGSTECRVYLQTDAPADYLLDSTSLEEIASLKNADFELTTYSKWFCMGRCTLSPSEDAYQGQFSVLISNRKILTEGKNHLNNNFDFVWHAKGNQRWKGAAQKVSLKAGSRYKMTGYVKFVTTKDSKPYQEIGVKLNCKDANGASKYYNMGSTPRAELGQWYQVGGVVLVPEGSSQCKFYFPTDYPADYLLDATSLEEVSLAEDWKTKAETTIEEIRKATTNIRLTGTGLENNNLQYEIVQTGSEFIWGSAVGANKIVDPSYSKYQEVFNDNFEWAVLENSLKWAQMEPVQGRINYDLSLNAIHALRAKGKKVRGHCTFWSVDQTVQNWVRSLSGSALEEAVTTRIQGVVGQNKGLLEHWDVNNENQHGDFYERQSGNPNITKEMFRQIRDLDRTVKLYLNDFGIISSSNVAVATKDQAERYLREGVPLSGIGVQGHLRNVDLSLIKARLDLLAETGLPILITELGVNDADVNSRASKLSDLLYLFHSHPAVEGVMFWGFWDGKIWESDAPMFNGPNVEPNAAGLVYQDLRRKWTSQATGELSGSGSIEFRGFKGTYTLNIKQFGITVTTKTFDLTDDTPIVDFHLNIPVPVVKNDKFESASLGDHWVCRGGCTLSASTNAHDGQKSVLITDRTQSWSGLAQNLNVKGGSRYRITAFIYLLNTKDNKLYQIVGLSMNCKDSTGASNFYSFGKTPRAEPGKWYEIGGAQKIPDGNTNCVLYVVTDLPSDYYLDSVTAEELELPNDWKTTAAETIEAIRKADITLSVSARSNQLEGLQYEVTQTGHEFVWGSAVSATHIVKAEHSKYQEVFYENFEWGVLENALKWKQMERKQGIINYDTAMTAIDALRSHGKKVRGHCVFWAVDKWVPDWVTELSGQELEEAISTRIEGVVNKTKGLYLGQWDVNNEDQHGDFYERSTGKTNITMEMFEIVHEIDSEVRLYLNDYGIISSSSSVVANKDQAVRMMKNNVPISGIGVQGHLHSYDLTLIKGRLDILAEAGLPILITELGVNDVTDEGRASKLSDLMYLFFGHPSIEGVIFWGFWDGRIWEPDAPLFNGPDVTPNAAGDVYLDLRKQWTTNVSGSFNGAASVNLRGFKGEYTARVLRNGVELASKDFTLSDGGAHVNLDLNA